MVEKAVHQTFSVLALLFCVGTFARALGAQRGASARLGARVKRAALRPARARAKVVKKRTKRELKQFDIERKDMESASSKASKKTGIGFAHFAEAVHAEACHSGATYMR